MSDIPAQFCTTSRNVVLIELHFPLVHSGVPTICGQELKAISLEFSDAVLAVKLSDEISY